ncbi:MAG: negative regulator of flagellin synthesis FlgM [Bacteroidia bacterium]|jgi:negative regulator of flagellin synthesis FlgM
MKSTDNTMSIKTPRADVNPGSHPSSPVSGASAAGTAATTGSKAPAVSGDTVTFTNTVAEMLKLEESLANIPDVDSARVAAIQTSIADGTYEIDAEKIVENLLKIEQDLS